MLGMIVLCTCALLAAVLITLLGVWYTLVTTKDKIEHLTSLFAMAINDVNAHALAIRRNQRENIPKGE